MSMLRRILRLRHEAGLSLAAIATASGTSKGTVSNTLQRARAAGLEWRCALDDAALEAYLYRPARPNPRAELAWADLAARLSVGRGRRRVAMTRR